jgi:hypothetical protein
MREKEMAGRCLAISLSAVCILMSLIAAGCSKSDPPPPLPKTIPAARDEAVKSRDAALAARQAKDPKAAAAASVRALAAAGVAAKLLAGPAHSASSGQVTQPSDANTSAQAASAARQAALLADLTAEDARLAELCGSWKARSYRTARGLAVKAVFVSLAYAARQAADANAAAMPEQLRAAADCAASVAPVLTGRGNLPDGKPDWQGIAKDMDALAANPSPQLAGLLAMGFLLAGQNRMALYEIEAVDPKLAITPVNKTAYHLLRGVTFSMNGLPRLGTEQVEASAAAAGQNPNSVGPQWLGTIHLYLAVDAISRRDFRAADMQLSRAMRAWPDNPVCVFLTGERLAADGRYEQAAESLEKQAAGTQYEWLARRLTARARQVRDNKGDAAPLFSDTGFMCDVMIHCVGEKAQQKAPRQLKGAIAAARSLTQRILDQLGGTTSAPAGKGA